MVDYCSPAAGPLVFRPAPPFRTASRIAAPSRTHCSFGLPVMSVNGARPGPGGDLLLDLSRYLQEGDPRLASAISGAVSGKLDAADVVSPSADPAGSGKAADAYATGAALARLADLVSAAGGRFVVVQTLPAAAEADPKAIYLVPRSPGEPGNVYDEYLRVEPTAGTYAWEKIGSTDIDLSGYVQTGDPRLSDARQPVAHVHGQADVTGLDDAFAARPTKAQIDEGWWSEWTFEFRISRTEETEEWVGIDDPRVQEEIASASLAYDSNDGWQLTLNAAGGGIRELSPSADAYDENATRLGFTILGGDDVIRATRHRVAAPVPTKPEDIGAQPQGDYATAAQLAPKRDKDDLAVYKKVGVGETWTLVSQDGTITTTATGVFHGSDGAGYWEFIIDGEPVAGSAGEGSHDDYVTVWSGAPEIGYTGTATRPSAYQPVAGDTLAKTSQIPAALAGAVRYNLVQTITLGQLQDRAVQKVVLNAASTTLVLPALTDITGKVSDFGVDVVNAYEVSGTPAAASFQLDGTLGTDYNLIVPKGETWSDMTALAADEMAVYYFTRSAFQIGDVPTWEVVKKVVEFVPVPTAP